ncbi:hypothetical protein [Micromonospora olivasterospora]|uniref:Uncharacterized protein n=1 Tax=Micromonospora olivasterospora TaxID=1880 RepID=A0A562HU75_MICOL|nr:hypothetical protein [Micromonospora olivasterospora]TWH62291.1 hypothetical protein JD77_06342 [Micromonospora olivasterospora]
MTDRQIEREVTSGPVLRCRYTACRAELAYSGRGRPPEYCPDRRWPGGKTCKQLAADERAAELAAGLDVPLAAYRDATARVLPAVQALSGELAAVVEAMRAVDGSAVARIAEAEAAAVAAVERAQTAEAERDKAVRDAGTARAETAAAAEARRTAERRAATPRPRPSGRPPRRGGGSSTPNAPRAGPRPPPASAPRPSSPRRSAGRLPRPGPPT